MIHPVSSIGLLDMVLITEANWADPMGYLKGHRLGSMTEVDLADLMGYLKEHCLG